MAAFDSSVLAAIFDRCDIDTKLRMAGSCPQLHAQFGEIARKIVARHDILAALNDGSDILVKYLPNDSSLKRHFNAILRIGKDELIEFTMSRCSLSIEELLNGFATLCEIGRVSAAEIVLRYTEQWREELMTALESDNDLSIRSAMHGRSDVSDMRGAARLMCEMLADRRGAVGTACCNGHIAIVEMLINRGDMDFEFGFRWACWSGHAELAEMLVRRGVKDGSKAFKVVRERVRELLYHAKHHNPETPGEIAETAARLGEMHHMICLLRDVGLIDSADIWRFTRYSNIADYGGYGDFADKMRSIGAGTTDDFCSDSEDSDTDVSGGNTTDTDGEY